MYYQHRTKFTIHTLITYRSEDHVKRQGDVEVEGHVVDNTDYEVEPHQQHVALEGNCWRFQTKFRHEKESFNRDEEKLEKSDNCAGTWFLPGKCGYMTIQKFIFTTMHSQT